MVSVVVGRVNVVVEDALRSDHPEFTGILLFEEPSAIRQCLLQSFTRRHDALLRHQLGEERNEGPVARSTRVI